MSDLKEVLGLLKSSRYDEALTALNGMINDSAKPISVDSRPHSADLDHSKDTLLCHRSLCLTRLLRLNEARIDAEAALEINPRNMKAHQRLAESYYFQELYQLAIESCQRGLSIDANYQPLIQILTNATTVINGGTIAAPEWRQGVLDHQHQHMHGDHEHDHEHGDGHHHSHNHGHEDGHSHHHEHRGEHEHDHRDGHEHNDGHHHSHKHGHEDAHEDGHGHHHEHRGEREHGHDHNHKDGCEHGHGHDHSHKNKHEHGHGHDHVHKDEHDHNDRDGHGHDHNDCCASGSHKH